MFFNLSEIPLCKVANYSRYSAVHTCVSASNSFMKHFSEGKFQEVSHVVLALLVDQVLRLVEAGGVELCVDNFALWHDHFLTLHDRIYLNIVFWVWNYTTKFDKCYSLSASNYLINRQLHLFQTITLSVNSLAGKSWSRKRSGQHSHLYYIQPARHVNVNTFPIPVCPVDWAVHAK